MIRKTLLIAALAAVPTIAPIKAEASGYCREYTKTVSIGGRTERAYGTACYKPDGAWEIVDLQGSDYGRTKVREVIHDDLHSHHDTRYRKVVIRDGHHSPYHYTRTSTRYYSGFPFGVSFVFGDHDHHHNNKHYKTAKYHHDNKNDDRGHGKGHDRHR